MSFAFLKASTDYPTMVRTSEEALKQLCLLFVKNGHQTLTEYEVTRPAYFRIVIEPNKIPKSRNLFMPSISAPKGSTLDVRFGLDSDNEEAHQAAENAKEFLRLLVNSLPSKPWIGLGTLESGREEKRWKSFL